MRSQKKILERIKDRRSQDMLGFEWPMYIDALSYKNAKPYLKDEVSEDQWKTLQRKSDSQVRQSMIDYLPFAWEKANEKRGISAQRSIMHYIAWLWLLNDQEAYDKVTDMFYNNYEFYGKDILKYITEYLDVDVKQYDDGVREND